MTDKTGGAAFSRPFSKAGEYSDSIRHHAQEGMTLRDYFAAKAMQSFLSNEAIIQRHNESAAFNYIDPDVLMATSAYIVADAMLRERAK